MDGTTKQPDLLDVAREAGVSRSTASRALLGHNRISEATRLRVLRVAESLGYVPDRRAVELATSTREKRGIGLLVRAAHHSFYGEMINAVQQVMEEAGRELIIASAIGDAQRQMATLNELRGHRIEGLIVASGRILEEDIQNKPLHIPVVFAGREGTSTQFGSVSCDPRGVDTLVQVLLDEGHRRIGLVTLSRESSVSRYDRAARALRLFKRKGIKVIDIPLAAGQEAPSPQQLDDVIPKVTAIMAINDPCLVSIWEFCQDKGLSVPNELSLVGYDGVGQLATPLLGITTWRQPVTEIGAVAAQEILRLTDEPDAKPKRILIAGEFVRGRTLGKPLNP